MSEPEPFLIQHRSSGKFFRINCDNPEENANVVLHSKVDDGEKWIFVKKTKYWGYIKHVRSKMIIHPFEGNLKPEDNTQLVVNSDDQDAALFALDAKNGHIIHKGGRYAHPLGGDDIPVDDTRVVLHFHVQRSMRFQFVSPGDLHTEVLVYGHPSVIGKWERIHAVINPKAKHKSTVIHKIGKSKTESKKSTFEHKWEYTFGVEMVELFKASVGKSEKDMMDKTSSETWTEETTETREIIVKPGDTVVTWQYKFLVEQDESRAIFQSNLFGDTDSLIIVPGGIK